MITIGNNEYSTHKTTGDLNEEIIVEEQECTELIDAALLQPKEKIIKVDTFSQTSIFNATLGIEEIGPIFVPVSDNNLGIAGYDYIIEITPTITSTNLPGIFGFMRFSPDSTAGTPLWFDNSVAGGVPTFSLHSTQINESMVGGDYSNGIRTIWVHLTDTSFTPTPFTLDLDIKVKQLIPASVRIEKCNGVYKTIDTELETETVEVNVVDNEGIEGTTTVTVRKKTYDPFWDISESNKFYTNYLSCLTYDIYFQGTIYLNQYLLGSPPNEFYIDTGLDEMKIDIPITPPQVLDFKIFDGTGYVYTNTSDLNGFTEFQTFPILISSPNAEVHIFDGATQILESGEQTVYARYDVINTDCPCDCITPCEGTLKINFFQKCDDVITLNLKASVHSGVYDTNGESYTPNNGIAVRPVVRQAAKYTLTIDRYSDEVWLALQELISDNLLIEIFDNNNLAAPSTTYNFDLESFSPTWDSYSKYGYVNLPIIRIDTVKTKRKCCE